MLTETGFQVEIEHKPRQPWRTGRPEVLNRHQAERRGREVYRGVARPFGLRGSLLRVRTRCRVCMAWVNQIEAIAREAEESDQKGEEKDAPQG
jgi:hypothetical protein